MFVSGTPRSRTGSGGREIPRVVFEVRPAEVAIGTLPVWESLLFTITSDSTALSVSPDSRWILYTRRDLQASNLMLLDGLR